MAHTVLEVRGLTKSCGQILAVDRLTLELHRGEVFGLLGPNGAGKTTSINMICGLLKPDEGTVLIHGEPINKGRGGVVPVWASAPRQLSSGTS
jgi:ABC-2 type transport system ATP-binding protein